MATTAQGWVLLGLLGVAFATIIGLVQWGMRNGFKAIQATIGGQLAVLIEKINGLETNMNTKFDAVNQRIDNLDRDVQAVSNKVFGRD